MYEAAFPEPQIALARAQSEGVLALEFSVYDVRDSLENRRRVYRVEVDSLRAWWERTTSVLGEFEEIGLNSRVQLAGRADLVHLPMIDLKGSDRSSLGRLSAFVREQCPEIHAVRWFASGRSFHGYGEALLDEKRWRYFMGSLLLYRQSDLSDLAVDTRWIGHRLRDGYACLRLTRRSQSYAGRPTPLQDHVQAGLTES